MPAELPILTTEDLNHTYAGSRTPALAGLDLTVAAGEIFGLLGPNGAGKTTAIRIMSTLMRPSAGSVTICDNNALTSPRRVRPLIGVVPQELALYETLTARENLNFFGRIYGLSAKDLAAAVQRSLALTGLSDQADRRIDTFSGGMRRRANLAAGIVHQPKLLFLDEPTVGIDAQSRQMILERLKDLQNNGMTLIYTTHYMEEAEFLCSRVAVMDNGRRIAAGQPQQLLDDHPDCENLGAVFLKLTGKALRD